MTVCTLLFEGDKAQCSMQEKHIYGIASKYHGLKAGAANGERGYMLTYVIAYVRDLGTLYNFIAESFETSCPWSQVSILSKNVNEKIMALCVKHGVGDRVFVSFRVTQVYETGAAVYIYFGFNYVGVNNPVAIYEEVETEARNEIIKSGGSISHHHGIGKIRKQFVGQTMNKVGQGVLKDMKESLDPKNIFAINNTVDYFGQHDTETSTKLH